MLPFGCVVFALHGELFLLLQLVPRRELPMSNYFFGLNPYLTQTAADAELFRRPQLVPYRQYGNRVIMETRMCLTRRILDLLPILSLFFPFNACCQLTPLLICAVCFLV